jgi:hypothetical protein
MRPEKRRILSAHRRAPFRRPFFRVDTVRDAISAAYLHVAQLHDSDLVVPAMSEFRTVAPPYREKMRLAFRRGLRRRAKKAARVLMTPAVDWTDIGSSGPAAGGNDGGA